MLRFKICRDCYLDAQKDTGLCPGCKEPYRTEYDDDPHEYSSGTLQLPAPDGSNRDPSNMTMMKRNQNGEFDHNRWLFETKGTYGVGNAYWPQEDMYGDEGDDGFHGNMMDPNNKPWKPLSRKTPIPAGIISPYRSIHTYMHAYVDLHIHLFKLYFSIKG